jgi:hypothetical protein
MCLPQTPATTFKASPFTSRDVNAGESNQAPLLPNETPVSGVGQGAFEGFFYKIHYDEELMHSSFQSGDAILHEIYNLNLQETCCTQVASCAFTCIGSWFSPGNSR